MPPETFARLGACVATHARSGARLLVTANETAALPLDAGLVRDAVLETYVTGCDRAPGGAVRHVLRRA